VRQRDAERAAKKFIAERYKDYEHWHFDICLEHDGERKKSWSFGLRPDEEDPEYEPHTSLTGYVHADGYVEGLY
jgi:hypothetical protein